MMSEDLNDDIIGKLRGGVSQLVARYRQAIEEKLEAERTLLAQKQEIELLRKKVDEISGKCDKLITARSFSISEGDVKSARSRVNKLVREIDKCISLLNE